MPNLTSKDVMAATVTATNSVLKLKENQRRRSWVAIASSYLTRRRGSNISQSGGFPAQYSYQQQSKSKDRRSLPSLARRAGEYNEVSNLFLGGKKSGAATLIAHFGDFLWLPIRRCFTTFQKPHGELAFACATKNLYNAGDGPGRLNHKTRQRSAGMDFRVNLEIFRGPLDLLLYLVRKHEVEIMEIPIAPITDQFLQYLAVLEQLDINVVGDFVDMASTLIEIKSRMVLPRGGEEEDELEDPRQELVQRLLEYKKFKDAASMLEERSRDWQQRYPRLSNDLPPRQLNLAEQEIHEVELWDLVSAFGRVMRDMQTTKSASIVYDDTPIHVYMTQLHAQLQEKGRILFSGLFEPGMHKSKLVGIFLAVLELVRHYRVRTEQNALFGQLWIIAGPDSTGPLDLSQVDNYEHGRRADDAQDNGSEPSEPELRDEPVAADANAAPVAAPSPRPRKESTRKKATRKKASRKKSDAPQAEQS